MFSDQKKQLYIKLLQNDYLRESQLEEIENLAAQNNKHIVEILVNGGYVEEEKLTELLSEIFDLPYVNLVKTKYKESAVVLPKELADKFQMLIFEQGDDFVNIAFAYFDNPKAREFLDDWARQVNINVNYYICSASNWHKYYQLY